MKRRILRTIAFLFCCLAVLIAASVRWLFAMFGNISMYDLMFGVQAPLEGTGSAMIRDYLLWGLLPAVLVMAVLVLIRRFLTKERVRFGLYYSGIGIVLLALSAAVLYVRLDLKTYLRNRAETDTFIEDHYVSPASRNLIFPEQKRNLIYIFMESMETTFADPASGGAFEENLIPELTALALEYEDFSAPDGGILNGGYALPGATVTMSAIVAQTAGLPLMNVDYNFLPGVTALGDILKREGYHQTLVIGSDSVFAGGNLYFTEHGGYAIHDYPYALKNGLIPFGHYANWGYEDLCLYDIAKKDLLELSGTGEPFHLTMMTMDTHFPVGYTCELCQQRFDSPYANAIACSSRQLADFIAWIQEQDFYENTTIVISGDHPSMAADFMSGKAEGYPRRTYTAVINAPLSPENPTERVFSTFDMFPTTLAALGVTIEGNRLGLGTNLFSEEPTLLERYGTADFSAHLTKRSLFLEEFGNYDADSDEMLSQHRGADFTVVEDAETGALYVYLNEKNIHLNYLAQNTVDTEQITGYYMEVSAASGSDTKIRADFTPGPGGFLTAVYNTPRSMGEDVRIDIFAQDATGSSQRISFLEGDPALMRRDDPAVYLTHMIQHAPEASLLLCGYGFRTNSLQLKEVLRSIGLTQLAEVKGGYYTAVVDGETIREASNEAMQFMDGTLSGQEIPFEILSSTGTTSITVNGEFFAPYKAGGSLMMIAYDPEAQTVTDYVVFANDTSAPRVSLRRSTEDATLLEIKVSDIDPPIPFTEAELVFTPGGRQTEDAQIIFLASDEAHETFSASFPLAWLTEEEASLSVRVKNEITGYFTVSDIREEELQTLLTWEEYLPHLASFAQEEYGIVLLLKDDLEARGLFPELFEGLDTLGIETTLTEEIRSVWYAVIMNGEITEPVPGEHLSEYDASWKGGDGNDINLHLRATDWYESDKSCFVSLNGQEYLFDHRGMNALIFDRRTGEVIDQVCFDLYEGGWCVRRYDH